MKKLVVIDDDPIDHFLIKHMMRGNEYFDTTTYAVDGSLILDYIEENGNKPEKLPDVILLDLNMPMFTGWDFLERMQAISSAVKKNIKVHVLTSSLRVEDSEHAEQYPFVRSVISKPLTPNTIEKITQRHFVE
ncbi:MAG TPA: response regulator [Mucilaginibacter sp.]|jgi:CheY-like chemotaxis protein|nr:response regulator [Mucilaginibacter sp.]